MPLLRVDATAQGPRLHGSGDLDEQLASQLQRLGRGQPVVVLVHGFRFSPSDHMHDPHTHILSLAPSRACWKALSWPRQLGFDGYSDDEGLCIAFGWEARGTIWRAWHNAGPAGAALGDLIARIQAVRPGKVDMIAHSLGARVCLSAIPGAPVRSIGRLVLMAAAEFQSAALAAMQSPGGRGAEVVNITSRENDLFDALVEWAVPRRGRADRTLGAGLAAPGWLDVQIDAPETRRALEKLGFCVPPPDRRICHWSAYLRQGLMPFYTCLIRDRARLSLPRLTRLLRTDPEPRWARLRWPYARKAMHIPNGWLRGKAGTEPYASSSSCSNP